MNSHLFSPKLASRILLLSIAAVALSGCSFLQNKINEKVSETVLSSATGQDMDIKQDGQAYTVTTDEGTMTVGATDLTALKKVVSLPDWIIGSESSGVISSESDGKTVVYASVVSQKSLAETYAYFESYFAQNGFKDITKADSAGAKMISGSKGESSETTLAVTVSPSDDGSEPGIQVVIAFNGPAAQ